MNIIELQKLADWFTSHNGNLRGLYKGLIGPIHHNASQPNKQPLEAQLEALLGYLRGMSFEELSLQQLKVLSELEVDQFIGPEGAAYVESIVRTADYDPATASQRITAALEKLNQVNAGFDQYRNALAALSLNEVSLDQPADTIIIRVGFQNEASIDNVADWKESARDWYEIVRGLALAADEAPEDTKVIGAATGSIILILAGTVTVTTLLAVMSKNIASIAKEVIGLRNQVEDLRHKKWLNATIEREFKKKEESLKATAVKQIIAEIKRQLPSLDGEKVSALEASTRKLLSFNEKGGNVDFVAPDGGTSDSEEEGVSDSGIAAVQAAIRDYQSVREQLKLITDQSEG